jgi:hypothetical protein
MSEPLPLIEDAEDDGGRVLLPTLLHQFQEDEGCVFVRFDVPQGLKAGGAHNCMCGCTDCDCRLRRRVTLW